MGNQPESIAALQACGADLEAVADTDMTPILMAAGMNRTAAIRALAAAGVAIDAPGTGKVAGVTPILMAAGGNHAEAIRMLAECGASPDSRMPGTRRTALHLAVLRNNLDAMQALIDVGCDVNATDDDGNTALHFAATKTEWEPTESLMKAGANPNRSNNEGLRPIDIAGSRGNARVCITLDKAGAIGPYTFTPRADAHGG